MSWPCHGNKPRRWDRSSAQLADRIVTKLGHPMHDRHGNRITLEDTFPGSRPALSPICERGVPARVSDPNQEILGCFAYRRHRNRHARPPRVRTVRRAAHRFPLDVHEHLLANAWRAGSASTLCGIEPSAERDDRPPIEQFRHATFRPKEIPENCLIAYGRPMQRRVRLSQSCRSPSETTASQK